MPVELKKGQVTIECAKKIVVGCELKDGKVVRVFPSSGLLGHVYSGDLLTAINGKPIANTAEFYKMCLAATPGKLIIDYERDELCTTTIKAKTNPKPGIEQIEVELVWRSGGTPIGILVHKRETDDRVVVGIVEHGSAASKIVLPGDILFKVNNVEVKDKDVAKKAITDAVNRMKRVTLTVERSTEAAAQAAAAAAVAALAAAEAAAAAAGGAAAPASAAAAPASTATAAAAPAPAADAAAAPAAAAPAAAPAAPDAAAAPAAAAPAAAPAADAAAAPAAAAPAAPAAGAPPAAPTPASPAPSDPKTTDPAASEKEKPAAPAAAAPAAKPLPPPKTYPNFKPHPAADKLDVKLPEDVLKMLTKNAKFYDTPSPGGTLVKGSTPADVHCDMPVQKHVETSIVCDPSPKALKVTPKRVGSA